MDKENVPLRFGQASEDDIERILSAKTPKSTKSATAFWVKVFTDYIASGPSAGMDLKTAKKIAIAKVLELFYINICKKDQTLYKRTAIYLFLQPLAAPSLCFPCCWCIFCQLDGYSQHCSTPT